MPQRPPKRIPWTDDAPARLIHLARADAGNASVLVIGITGPLGAGKSTVASSLSPLVIRTDDYLPDYYLVPEHLRDLPESSDLARLSADITSLRTGQAAMVPVWSFQTHRREGERSAQPAPIIVVEGIHAFAINDHVPFNLRVFVEAPAHTRWSRWRQIEQSGERGWGVERARDYFNSVAEPAFQAREAHLRILADVFIENG